MRIQVNVIGDTELSSTNEKKNTTYHYECQESDSIAKYFSDDSYSIIDTSVKPIKKSFIDKIIFDIEKVPAHMKTTFFDKLSRELNRSFPKEPATENDLRTCANAVRYQLLIKPFLDHGWKKPAPLSSDHRNDEIPSPSLR